MLDGLRVERARGVVLEIVGDLIGYAVITVPVAASRGRRPYQLGL